MDIFIDIGNTNASFFVDGQVFSITTPELSHNNCKDFLQKHNPKRVFIASVVPSVSNALENSCKNMGIFCKNLVFDDLNLRTTLQNNAELGIDRAINAVHGMKKFGENVIIVDFGTALTFDIIHNCVYQGGMIFPGLAMAMHNLHTKTAKLPSVNIQKFQSGIGKNTVDAIRFGAAIGYEGVLKNTLAFVKNTLNEEFRIVFTGGSGRIFFEKIDGATFEDNLILEYLVEKYGN